MKPIAATPGWVMVAPTTLQCFLCQGQVIYKNKDTTRSLKITQL